MSEPILAAIIIVFNTIADNMDCIQLFFLVYYLPSSGFLLTFLDSVLRRPISAVTNSVSFTLPIIFEP